MLDKLKKLDAYPKTLEDFRIKTLGGGAVTLVSSIIMLVLFVSELRDYLRIEITEDLYVDMTRYNKLTIKFDVYFPAIACEYLGLDLADTSGQQHKDVAHSVYKLRLNLDGHPIDEPVRQDNIGTKNMTQETLDDGDLQRKAVTKKASICGSCYGAETELRRCCNTCQEVREAYGSIGWELPTDLADFEQCKGHTEGVLLKEGCQIYGKLKVARIGGSFHVAPGISYDRGHFHVHDLKPFSAKDFNVSHTFNEFSFGKRLDSLTPPLQSIQEISDEGGLMYKYYLKIVPTKYIKYGGEVLHSYQYSVTRHIKRSGDNIMSQDLPGLYVHYELSPMMVVYTETSRSFGQFATSVCAIIGGVFTVASLLDSFLYKSAKLLQKKTQLGKVF